MGNVDLGTRVADGALSSQGTQLILPKCLPENPF